MGVVLRTRETFGRSALRGRETLAEQEQEQGSGDPR